MDFITRYQQPSRVSSDPDRVLIFLASTGVREQPAAVPELFSGRIAQPLLFRNVLLGLRQTMQSLQSGRARL
jgi:hypothetical protein